MGIVEHGEAARCRTDLPAFGVGDTVRVRVRIVEDERVRTQDMEGIVIARRGAGMRESFTVRRISYGEGVERVFPLQAPSIQGIQVVRRAKARRAKLYYLRRRAGSMKLETKDDVELPAPAAEPAAPSAPERISTT